MLVKTMYLIMVFLAIKRRKKASMRPVLRWDIHKHWLPHVGWMFTTNEWQMIVQQRCWWTRFQESRLKDSETAKNWPTKKPRGGGGEGQKGGGGDGDEYIIPVTEQQGFKPGNLTPYNLRIASGHEMCFPIITSITGQNKHHTTTVSGPQETTLWQVIVSYYLNFSPLSENLRPLQPYQNFTSFLKYI